MSKKSFVLFNDYYEQIKLLSQEQKGFLLDALFTYEIEDKIIELDPMTNLAFSFIKTQLDRSREKYANVCERNKVNGSKAKSKREATGVPDKPVAYLGSQDKPKEAKKADTDTDTDTDTKTDSDTNTKDNISPRVNKTFSEEEKKKIKWVVAYLNKQSGKNFKDDGIKTSIAIVARINEGYTSKDFKLVIDTKVDDWIDDIKYSKFLRPETLFGTKFEGYLNEKPKKKEVVLSKHMQEPEYLR